MKKLNKKIENKLQKLMMRAYPVTVNDINDEIWATNKKIKEKTAPQKVSKIKKELY